MFVHDKLKELREQNAKTHTDVLYELDKVGLRISRPTLIKWEHGVTSPTAKDLDLLAQYWGKSPKFFYK